MWVERGELCRGCLVGVEDRGDQPVALLLVGQGGILEPVLDDPGGLAVALGFAVPQRVDAGQVGPVRERLLTREPDVGLDPPEQLRPVARAVWNRSKL